MWCKAAVLFTFLPAMYLYFCTYFCLLLTVLSSGYVPPTTTLPPWPTTHPSPGQNNMALVTASSSSWLIIQPITAALHTATAAAVASVREAWKHFLHMSLSLLITTLHQEDLHSSPCQQQPSTYKGKARKEASWVRYLFHAISSIAGVPSLMVALEQPSF